MEGEYLWELKDKIDRTWMRGYQDLPDKEEMMKEMLLLKKNKNKGKGTQQSIQTGGSP